MKKMSYCCYLNWKAKAAAATTTGKKCFNKEHSTRIRLTFAGKFTDSVLEFLDRVLTPTDDKAEVLAACLKPATTGEYEPVEMRALGFGPATTTTAEIRTSTAGLERGKRREHVRGKAGGGWESDEEDRTHEDQRRLAEEKEREQLKEALVALQVTQVDRKAE